MFKMFDPKAIYQKKIFVSPTVKFSTEKDNKIICTSGAF